MDTLPIINRLYELYKDVVGINHKIEKRWRYSLGNNLETTVLDCLQEAVMAKNAPKPLKSAYLIKALGYQELIVFKLRLFLELEVANETKIFQAQSKISEVGKMLGGWLKSVNSL